MSIEKIHLRKLLLLLYADNRLRRRLLLADVRNDRRKAVGEGDGARDFYNPFWAAAKAHAAGDADILTQIKALVSRSKQRRRLYPILADAFLEMWNEKMRWRNEPFQFIPESVKAQLDIKELSSIIKIENTAAVETWNGSRRVIYPYFSETPALPEEGVRIGFSVLSSALPDYRLDEFRIVDFHRRAYFRPEDIGVTGGERQILLAKYGQLLAEWIKLRDERS